MSKYLQRIDLELDRLLSEGKEEKPKIKKPSCFLSKTQIDEHYDEHYLKYLVNLREAQKDLKQANDPNQFRSAASEVTLNFNAIKLHESYFSSLGSTKMNADFESLLKKNFGSKDNFMKQLKFVGYFGGQLC
jgi:superoxide dismutase